MHLHVYGDRGPHFGSLVRYADCPYWTEEEVKGLARGLTASGLHSPSSSQCTHCLSTKKEVNTNTGAAAQVKQKSPLPMPENALEWGSDELTGCRSPRDKNGLLLEAQ